MDGAFCNIPPSQSLVERDFNVVIETQDPVYVGSVMIVPRAHCETPFELTPEWVVSAEDAAFSRSNPHGVVDLSDDDSKQLDGQPMNADRHAAITGHLRQLSVSYWLR